MYVITKRDQRISTVSFFATSLITTLMCNNVIKHAHFCGLCVIKNVLHSVVNKKKTLVGRNHLLNPKFKCVKKQSSNCQNGEKTNIRALKENKNFTIADL